MATPSLLLIPDRYKAAKLYSQIPDSGAGDLTFARNSNATRVNSAGLIEKVRTNVLLQSNQFDTTWTNTNSTETSGQAGYDGTNNAWLLTATTGGGYIAQSIVDSGIITISVYAKAGTLNWLRITEFNGANAWFDLANGVVGATFSGTNAISRSIESVGGGWYRCSMTTVAGGNSFRLYPATANNSEASAGNIVIQAAQREQGDIATPYIPTTTAAVSVGITADIPRLDYTGGGCPSLLLEPQRTNLVTFSEQINNAAWSKVNTTVTANQTISPTGDLNMDLIKPDGSGSFPRIQQSISSSGVVTYSVFVKKELSDTITLFISAGIGADTTSAYSYTFSTNTFAKISGANADRFTSESFENDIVRISITWTTTSITDVRLYPVYNSTSTNGVYVWGAQLEVGSYATSYIPTLGSSVTRLADAASKTGISSLIGQTEGVLFVDFNANGEVIPARSIVYLTEALATANRVAIQYTALGEVQAIASSGGVTQGSVIFAITGRCKAAFAYSASGYEFFVNGVSRGTFSGSLPTSLTRIDFASPIVGPAGAMNGTIDQAALFTTRLTNAELASITSL